jgi:hypothetical protein
VHVAAYNLGLMMRLLLGAGTPNQRASRGAGPFLAVRRPRAAVDPHPAPRTWTTPHFVNALLWRSQFLERIVAPCCAVFPARPAFAAGSRRQRIETAEGGVATLGSLRAPLCGACRWRDLSGGRAKQNGLPRPLQVRRTVRSPDFHRLAIAAGRIARGLDAVEPTVD